MRTSAVFSLAVIVALSGCSHKTTISTGNGTATVTTSQDNKTATIQTKEGTVTLGAGAVDASKLGAPLYPGAKQNEGGAMTVAGGEGGSSVAAFTTEDSFDKVYDWYKGQMPAGSEKMKMSTAAGDMAQFVSGANDKDQTTVMITSKDNKTSIVISHNTKK